MNCAVGLESRYRRISACFHFFFFIRNKMFAERILQLITTKYHTLDIYFDCHRTSGEKIKRYIDNGFQRVREC